MQRFLAGPNVGRECPGSEELRAAFRIEVKRKCAFRAMTDTIPG
jgi:hypothetical protein